MPDKTHIIAVVNHKGGTGKTTISGALVSILGRMGYKVLGIDGCGQMNLTHSLGFERDKNKSLYAILKDQAIFEECIKKGEDIGKKFDFIVSDSAMASIDLDLSNRRLDRERVLYRKMSDYIDYQDPKNNHYDFIIIDTNPTLGMLNINIMVASDWVLIPLELSTFGIDGLDHLIDFFNEVRTVHPELKVLGAVINKMDKREGISHEAERVVKELFGNIIMKTKIRQDTQIKKAQWEGIPINLYINTKNQKRGGRANEDLHDLTKEVIERVKKS